MGLKLRGQMLHRQDHVSRSIVHRREPAFQGTANHGCDQLVHVGILCVLGHDQLAVAKDGNLVTDLENLIHLVGDVDQGHALLL